MYDTCGPTVASACFNMCTGRVVQRLSHDQQKHKQQQHKQQAFPARSQREITEHRGENSSESKDNSNYIWFKALAILQYKDIVGLKSGGCWFRCFTDVVPRCFTGRRKEGYLPNARCTNTQCANRSSNTNTNVLIQKYSENANLQTHKSIICQLCFLVLS